MRLGEQSQDAPVQHVVRTGMQDCLKALARDGARGVEQRPYCEALRRGGGCRGAGCRRQGEGAGGSGGTAAQVLINTESKRRRKNGCTVPRAPSWPWLPSAPVGIDERAGARGTHSRGPAEVLGTSPARQGLLRAGDEG